MKFLRYIRPSDGRIKFTHLQTRLLNLREVITKVTYTIIRLEVMIYSHKNIIRSYRSKLYAGTRIKDFNPDIKPSFSIILANLAGS